MSKSELVNCRKLSSQNCTVKHALIAMIADGLTRFDVKAFSIASMNALDEDFYTFDEIKDEWNKVKSKYDQSAAAAEISTYSFANFF
jgi:hypothetical protein